MNEIKTVKSTDELKRLFDFLSITFYEDAAEYGEHYFAMSERYEEMKKQFEADKDFLMYIESNDKIVAGITGKNMTDDRITIGVLAVDKFYRRKGLAKQLVLEFENRCRIRNIKHIS